MKRLSLLICVILSSLLSRPIQGEVADQPLAPGAALAWGRPSGRSAPPPGVLSPHVARALMDAQDGQNVRVILSLRQQVALDDLDLEVHRRDAARTRLVSALKATAARTQAPLIAHLEGRRATGAVVSYRPFWISNSVAVEAAPDIIRELARRDDVATIELDHYRQWLPPSASSILTETLRPAVAAGAVEWGIAHIQADRVWSSLHISGTGAVVASMDTGVDWLHPALNANYRGYNPHGPAMHSGNWFDAVTGSIYPFDDYGHGTHTIGTAVGREGVGVAPGARWVGVKVLSGAGSGYDSWIKSGFQWLLAPGGDPTRAPDIVNCSWGSSQSYLTTFQSDIDALLAAGVLPIFASGNSGPGVGSVSSPASLPRAFAVGAVDSLDHVAGFSGRGPSPWNEVRPHVVAPGVNVRSSLPGGVYGESNGTSMATPHVAGLAALLRAISPTLSVTDVQRVITSTVVPLGDPLPNNDTGWGRVDAFAAARSIGHAGLITGFVTTSGGPAIAGATVSATPRAGSPTLASATDEEGRYELVLVPGIYDLAVSAFAHQPATVSRVEVVTDAFTRQDVSLSPLPTGLLRGRITDASSGAPVSATVSLLGTPVQAYTDVYALTPPAGVYTIEARRLGYRLLTATAAVTVGSVTTVDFSLTPAPSILLLDSGAWYYDSQIGYFRMALDDLTYTYDEWSINSLPDQRPVVTDLLPYDVVVWSAPWDAPGYIGAEEALTGYLDGGGHLLLSGQDVAYLDGGGWLYQPYLAEYLKVKLAQDNARSWVLDGTPDDLFAGLTLTITGAGGADNQIYPDELAIVDPDSATQIAMYRGAGCGGVRVGTCLPYRAIYLSFGFEAINDRALRREAMARAVDWLVDAPPSVGLEVDPPAQTRIGLPGTEVTHALRLRHVGQSGMDDTFSLSLASVSSWTTRISLPEVTLAPCASTTLAITVTVPATAAWDARDVLTVTARSTLSPALQATAVLTSKAPAPVLLVDDDLFFEQREKYERALREAGVAFDFWQTCPATGICLGNSPPLHILRRYPIVVWWTGYDWHRPLTPGEVTDLERYLDEGGRLLLSSQDFLYRNAGTSLAGAYMGVLTSAQDITATMVEAVPESLADGAVGAWTLVYPSGYQNWSDGLEPTPGTSVALRDQHRWGSALARRGISQAVTFLAFPFEALPVDARAPAMERHVGWLSWLGQTTFAPQRVSASPGQVLTLSLRLINDGPVSVTASVSNTLPAALSLGPGSLQGPGVYTPSLRRVSWQGFVAAGSALTLSYRVTVAEGLSSGLSIANVARIGLEDHDLHMDRRAEIRVDAPDLAPSSLSVWPRNRWSDWAMEGVTCTLTLANAGVDDAPSATAAISLPRAARLVTGSLRVASGVATVTERRVFWSGAVEQSTSVTLSYALLPSPTLESGLLYMVAFLDDGRGGAWERPAWIETGPLVLRLPLLLREG